MNAEDLKQTIAKMEPIQGWFSEKDSRIFHSLLSEQTEQGLQGDIFEIGCFCGRSASFLYACLKGTEKLYLSDTFKLPNADILYECHTKEIVLDNMKKVNPSLDLNKLVIFEGYSKDIDESNLGYFRFIYVDGGHTETECLQDLELSRKHILLNGIICVDDYMSSHPREIGVTYAVDKFLAKYPSEFEVLLGEEYNSTKPRKLYLKKKPVQEQNAKVECISYSKAPKLSIILPTYNQEKFIAETLQSILSQTFQDFEVIIVNDGSTDGTQSIIERYSKNDSRIKIINQANKKLPGALNTGLKYVSGKYITWMSSDSLYKPGALDFLVTQLDQQPSNIGLLFTDFEIFGKRDLIIARQPKVYKNWDLLQGNFVGASFIFKKEFADKVGEYDAELECVEDWDYWIRMTEYCDAVHVPGCYARWRDHGDNMSNTKCFNLGPINRLKMLQKAKDRREKKTNELK